MNRDHDAGTVDVNERTYVAWNAHDADAVASVFAEDAVLREAGRPDELRGRAAIRAWAAALLTAFPDFHLERVALLVDGERHADRWVMTGTHQGEPTSAGDPTAAGATGGGGVLVIFNSSGSGESFTVPLPVDRWRLEGDPGGEYRYVFASTPPVWKIFVKSHKVSVRGGRDAWGYTLDESSQGSIAIQLTLGTGTTWCSDAQPRSAGYPPSTVAYDRPNKFQASRLQAAAPACPALP